MEMTHAITLHQHPVFMGDVRHLSVPELTGASVRELLLASDIDPHQLIEVVVNDRLLKVAEWDSVQPTRGDLLNVKYAVADGGGNGGGSDPVRIVIAVVAVIYGAYTGDWSKAFTYFTYAQTAYSVGQALGIFPIYGAGLSLNDASGAGSSDVSPTYSLSGGSNSARLYEPMPVVMGCHRIFPDYAAKPFTQYLGEDQYLFMEFNFGLSDMNISDIRIGNTPITEYADVDIYWGDANGQITSFPSNVDSSDGAELTLTDGAITRVTSPDTYRIGIDLVSSLYYASNDGTLAEESVEIKVEYKKHGTAAWLVPDQMLVEGTGAVFGSWQDVVEEYFTGEYLFYIGDQPRRSTNSGFGGTPIYDTHVVRRFIASSTGGIIRVTGSSQKPIRSSLYINVADDPNSYDVRLTRLTEDTSDARTQRTTSWTVLRSYQSDTATYKGQRRMGLKIRASGQLNGVISQLSGLGTARTWYWTGAAWEYGHTRNPAWWYLDFARGRKNADGVPLYGCQLADSRIDIDAIKAWAVFCDQNGLTFDVVFDKQQTAMDSLQTIARCGFGSFSYATGKLGVIWDAPNQSPSAVFGMSNIIAGTFKVEYISATGTDEVVVSYVNADNDWAQDQVRKPVPGTVGVPQKTATTEIMGCTNTAMAGKFVNLITAQQVYRRRTISFEVDAEGFVCTRGDTVILSHDLTQWGYSGRLIEVNGATLKLSRPVPVSGSEYLVVRWPDGSLHDYRVTGDGETDTLTADAPIELQANRKVLDHTFIFSPLPTPGKRVKIVSVQPVSMYRLRINCTDDPAEYYAAWNGDFETANANTLLNSTAPFITGLRVKEQLARSVSGTIVPRAAITWTLLSGVLEKTLVRYRVNGGSWVQQETTGTGIEIELEAAGTLEVTATGYSTLCGNTLTASVSVQALSLPLPAITGLTDIYRDRQRVAVWTAVYDVRPVSYEVRFGDAPDSAMVLGTVATPEFVLGNAGTYWFAAKAGTAYSEEWVSLVVIGSTIQQNVVAEFNEPDTGWAGTLTGGAAVIGDELLLAGVGNILDATDFLAIPDVFMFGGAAASGAYELPAAHAVNIGRPAECAVSLSYASRGRPINTTNFLTIADVLSVTDLYGWASGSAVTVTPQIAIAGEDGIYGEWRPFVPGSYVGQHFKARVMLETSDPFVTAVVTDLIFSVDVPDRYESYQLDLLAAGGSVTFDYPFNGGPKGSVVPEVLATIVDGSPGDTLLISTPTLEGVDSIQVVNGGVGVARRVNIRPSGY